MFNVKYIPHEILFDILARLPVKSLLQFTCVCKSWYTLISSPSFISAQLKRNAMKTACDYLLMHIGNTDCLSVFFAETYAKSSDLDFPRHESGYCFHIFGLCNGLLCISNRKHMERIYLWNPSIRKFKRLPECLIRGHSVDPMALGFGLHPGGNDYKVARIVSSWQTISVEVYSLRLDSWRRINAVPPAKFSASWNDKWAYLNGVVYWLVQQSSPDCCYNYIISFDMDSEVFQKNLLPDILLTVKYSISIRVFEKSLSLFHYWQEYNYGNHFYFCDIWVLEMDYWKIIRTILLPTAGKIAWPLGFNINGDVHFTTRCENWYYQELDLYDPKSQQVKDTGIKLGTRRGTRRRIYGYSESLLLL